MKTETKTLEALLHHALQKKEHAFTQVNEITAALKALDDVLETAPFAVHPRDIITGLQRASNLLSCFLYNIGNKVLPVTGSDKSSLVKTITRLHVKINHYLGQYCNVLPAQNPLIPVKNLYTKMITANRMLKLNAGITEVYKFLQPALETTIAGKTMHYHRWIWWSQFVAVYETAMENAVKFRDLLIMLNFNTTEFMSWVSATSIAEMNEAAEGGTNFLENTILKYDLMSCSPNAYMPSEKSVRCVLLTVLKRKLFCLSQFAPPRQHDKPQSTRWNTILSVPQLALLLRLLVDTKILGGNNQLSVFKNIASVMSTSKTLTVSSESLRINYYTPNNASKTIVKDYLLQMIRLINAY